jgi:AcrR family transcriptional regulator
MTHQQRGDETRARILAAAVDCFTRAGYDATGVAEICDRAGVSKGAFYHHFASKQAAFLALLDQWLHRLDASMQAARALGETAPQRLEQLAGMVEQVFEAAAGQIPMFLEFWRQAAKEPEVWQATIEPYRRYRESFAALIAEGIAEGSLRSVDPERTARVIVALGVGLVLQGILEPGGVEWGRTAEDAVQMLLEGVATQKAGRDRLAQ